MQYVDFWIGELEGDRSVLRRIRPEYFMRGVYFGSLLHEDSDFRARVEGSVAWPPNDDPDDLAEAQFVDSLVDVAVLALCTESLRDLSNNDFSPPELCEPSGLSIRCFKELADGLTSGLLALLLSGRGVRRAANQIPYCGGRAGALTGYWRKAEVRDLVRQLEGVAKVLEPGAQAAKEVVHDACVRAVNSDSGLIFVVL